LIEVADNLLRHFYVHFSESGLLQRFIDIAVQPIRCYFELAGHDIFSPIIATCGSMSG
jgi:hypothetical protein